MFNQFLCVRVKSSCELSRCLLSFEFVNNTSILKLTNSAKGTGKSNNYAYLVTDEPTKQSVIIDPANPPESV